MRLGVCVFRCILAPMVKLYLRENGRITRYREAWIHGSKVLQHWGPLGQRGASLDKPRDQSLSDEQNIAKYLDPWRAEGYAEIDLAEQWLLEVIYRVAGFGTEADLKKRHALEARLNELLGWTGLGHVDGGSIGSGTMEVGCFVVDPKLAKKVIEEDLRDTEFGNFSEILMERVE
jgi:hypothetical protein